MNMNFGTPASIDEQKTEKLLSLIKRSMYFSVIIMLSIGLYLIYFNFESAIEIKTINDETVMEVYKTSYIPPFKQIDFIINNVKTTTLNPAEEKRALGVKYSIDVENYNDHKIKLPIVSYSYSTQKELSEKINNAIQNKEEFSYVDKFEVDSLLGKSLIIIALIWLLVLYFLFDELLKPLILKQSKIINNNN